MKEFEGGIRITDDLDESMIPLANDHWTILYSPPISVETISQHFVHGLYSFISKFSRKEKLDIQRRIQKTGIHEAHANHFLPQYGIFLGENGIVPILWST